MAITANTVEARVVGKFKDEMSGKAKKAFAKIKAASKAAFKAASVASIAGIGSIAALTIKMAGDFESGMNRVKAVSGATGKEFKALREQAKQLGATTQFSATQAADAMGFLAQAGFEASKIVGAMPGTLNLAAAAQLDLGDAADIVSNILTGFNKDVSELSKVNDVLVKAFTSSNTNLQQLGEAMKFVGPIASAAGVDFEETTAALGLMGNAGIQAGMAGTSLRGAIARILDPTKEMTQTMAAAGLNFTDTAGKLLPLNQIVEQLGPSANDAGLFMDLFGQRAGPAMAALVSQGSGALVDFTAKLKDSGGSAQKIADIQMEGLQGAVKKIKSAFEGLLITLGDTGFLKVITNAAGKLAVWLGELSKNEDALKNISAFIERNAVPAFNGLVTVLGAAAASAKFLWRVFQSGIEFAADLTIAIEQVFNNIFGLIDKMPELGRQVIEKFAKGFKDSFNSLKNGLGNLIPDWMQKFLKQSSPAERGVLDSQLWGGQAVELYACGMEESLPSISEQSQAIVDRLAVGLQEIEAQTTTTVERQNEAFRDFQTSGLSALGAVKVGWRAYQNQAQTTNLIISRGTTDTANKMRTSMSNALSNMITGAQSATDAIKGFFVGLGNSIVKIFTDIIANQAVNAILDFATGGNGFSFTKNAGGGGGGGGSSGVNSFATAANVGSAARNVSSASSSLSLSGPGSAATEFIGPPTETQALLNEAAPALDAAQAVAAGAAAGFVGRQAAGLVTAGGKNADIGAGVGGAAGFVLGGPIGAGIGSFFGGVIGGLLTERLSREEKQFGDAFKKVRKDFDDPFSELAVLRLRFPDVGADSVADALNNRVGRNLFPGTSFLRDDPGPEGVNALTIKGFKNLIDSEALTREQIENGLTDDLSFFLGKFNNGGFVPRGTSGFGFFEGEKDELVIPGKAGGGNPVLDKLDAILNATQNGGSIQLTVVTADGEIIKQELIEEIKHRSVNGEEIVVNAG